MACTFGLFQNSTMRRSPDAETAESQFCPSSNTRASRKLYRRFWDVPQESPPSNPPTFSASSPSLSAIVECHRWWVVGNISRFRQPSRLPRLSQLWGTRPPQRICLHLSGSLCATGELNLSSPRCCAIDVSFFSFQFPCRFGGVPGLSC